MSEVRLLSWHNPAGFERIIIQAGVPATNRTLQPANLPPPEMALVQKAGIRDRDADAMTKRLEQGPTPTIVVADASGDLGPWDGSWPKAEWPVGRINRPEWRR